jgi:uncharacterized protein YcnI
MQRRHLIATGALGLVGAFALTTPAAAHVYPDVTEAAAGSFVKFNLVVPHGCEEAATTRLEVQIPEGIYSVTPQVVPGWTISKTTEELAEPVDDGHGGEHTSRDAVVTWEGGPLAHDQLEEFGLSVQMPDTPGETILFPTIQTCEGGAVTEWIEPTPEDGEEPEHPAPAIAITEASGGGHGGGETEDGDMAEVTGDAVAASSEADDDDDDSATPLAIAALVAGLAGLGLGGVAFVRSGRSS